MVNDQSWVEFSSEEKLAPTLAAAVAELSLERHLPEDLVLWLQLVRRYNAERNQRILEEIDLFTKHLNCIEVQPCFLKGAAHLLDNVYESVEDRFLLDVDCLIPRKQITGAYNYLVTKGYTPWEIEGISDTSAHMYPLVSPNYEICFELHRHLSYLAPIDSALLPPSAILADSRIERRGEATYRIPSVEHRLSHALAHAALAPGKVVRGGLYLRDLVDLDLLVQRSSAAEQRRSIAHFHSSALLRVRAEAMLCAGTKLFGTPIEGFGPTSLGGRVQRNTRRLAVGGPGKQGDMPIGRQPYLLFPFCFSSAQCDWNGAVEHWGAASS